MQKEDFEFDLPPELIAQRPCPERQGSRLLVLPQKECDAFEHRRFVDLLSCLRPSDLLVLNDTRVIPARLYGRKATGGKIELLLDRPLGEAKRNGTELQQNWACLVRASKPLRFEQRVALAGGASAKAIGKTPENSYVVQLCIPGEDKVEDYLQRQGQIPLPAYIRRDAEEIATLDRERYQTVYAENAGAVAAPTAGLHFDKELLQAIADKGVEIVRVTLHVGPGTFLPVRCNDLSEHKMHPERYVLSEGAVGSIQAAKQVGRRVVAVGTTVVRTLEGAFLSGFEAGQGMTDIFIRPGFQFNLVDALLTNFHLPGSTLIMLVAAFAGHERVMEAYRQAVLDEYRFYSYGDAMFVAGKQ